MAPSGSDEKRAASRIVPSPDDHVILNDLRIPLRNWSPVGLLFGPMGTPPRIGQKIELKVVVKYRSDRIRFLATADVVRVDNTMVAVRYECKGPPEALIMIKAYFAGEK